MIKFAPPNITLDMQITVSSQKERRKKKRGQCNANGRLVIIKKKSLMGSLFSVALTIKHNMFIWSAKRVTETSESTTTSLMENSVMGGKLVPVQTSHSSCLCSIVLCFQTKAKYVTIMYKCNYTLYTVLCPRFRYCDKSIIPVILKTHIIKPCHTHTRTHRTHTHATQSRTLVKKVRKPIRVLLKPPLLHPLLSSVTHAKFIVDHGVSPLLH